MNKHIIQCWGWTALLLVLWVNYAQADNEAPLKTLSPYFFIEQGDSTTDSFPLKATQADIVINGVIADVSIRQQYENHGARPINAQYIFPASTRAAVHGLRLTIGNRVIAAKIQERQRAKQTFNRAKQEGKSASLLEQQRPNVFSMSVANIMPGDKIDIELDYTELLVPEAGVYEFVFPTVVGPRYAKQPEALAADTETWVKNPYLSAGSPPTSTFTIQARISGGVPLQDIDCPSHQAEVHWESETVAEIRLDPAQKFGGDRDFILKYRLTGSQIQSGAMLYAGSDENFFLFMAQPPERVVSDQIPRREYIFVVDVSGSMNGFPLKVTNQLLRNLVSDLRPIDKFNVVLFAGGSTLMSSASVDATPENINTALAVIERERGGGGTELLAALQKAMSLPADEQTSRSLLLITDGYITAEADVFRHIEQHLGQANIFAFGIGSSVNRYLIEGIAKAGQGEPFIVIDPAQAPSVAERFRRYIQSPVLTHITVAFDGFEAHAVEPTGLPDMLAERPLIIYGKYRGAPQGVIRITGVGGQGEFTAECDLSRIEPSDSNRALPYLWARKRIEKLSDHCFSGLNQDQIGEITSLGLTYNLLTAYTSFVAVHDEIRNPEGLAKDVKQPLPLPKGVPNSAVGVSSAAVKAPEPELGFLALAAAALAAIALLRQRQRERRA